MKKAIYIKNLNDSEIRVLIKDWISWSKKDGVSDLNYWTEETEEKFLNCWGNYTKEEFFEKKEYYFKKRNLEEGVNSTKP